MDSSTGSAHVLKVTELQFFLDFSEKTEVASDIDVSPGYKTAEDEHSKIKKWVCNLQKVKHLMKVLVSLTETGWDFHYYHWSPMHFNMQQSVHTLLATQPLLNPSASRVRTSCSESKEETPESSQIWNLKHNFLDQ